MTYAQLREQKKSELIARYKLLFSTGSYGQAYAILQQIMKFKLVTPESSLGLSAIRKLRLKGLDVSEIGAYDFRRKDDKLPENLLLDSIKPVGVNVVSRAHWAKRREKQYVGDIILPENKLKYTISCKTNESASRSAYNGVLKLLGQVVPECRKHLVSGKLQDRIMTGQSKICAVELSFGQSYRVRTLGYVVITTINDKVKVETILDYPEMVDNYIMLVETQATVKEELRKSLASQTDMKIEFDDFCDVKQLGEFQREKYSHDPELNYEKHMEDYNSKVAEEQAV